MKTVKTRIPNKDKKNDWLKMPIRDAMQAEELACRVNLFIHHRKESTDEECARPRSI